VRYWAVGRALLAVQTQLTKTPNVFVESTFDTFLAGAKSESRSIQVDSKNCAHSIETLLRAGGLSGVALRNAIDPLVTQCINRGSTRTAKILRKCVEPVESERDIPDTLQEGGVTASVDEICLDIFARFDVLYRQELAESKAIRKTPSRAATPILQQLGSNFNLGQPRQT